MYSELMHEGSWVIQTDELELGFSLDSGMLTILRRLGGVNMLNVGGSDLSLDAQTPWGWMSERTFPRYLSHTVHHDHDAVILAIHVGLGGLSLIDTLRITGTLVARTVAVTNNSVSEEQLLHVRLNLPFVCIGNRSDARFEAPSNSFRPRLALETVAKLRRGELPGRAIAPAIRRSRLFENAPDRGPGLLAVHSASLNENVLCWYWSTVQPAWPDINGNDEAITLGHDIELAGWLAPDQTISGGTQYFMLVKGTWFDAMSAFHATWSVLDVHGLGDIAEWTRDAAIYEVHPGLWGGFASLTAALPHIRSLGFNTLNIMPIWRYDNRSGQPWDLNWAASGSPYAIEDFEALEPTLGTPQEFRALVDRAHELGMRVLCDLVVQGCSRTSRYLKEHPGWFCRDVRGRIVSSHGWNDTASFDWANPEVQEFFLDWTTRFIEKFDIDGWRVDAPHRKEPNWDRRLERPASSTSFGVLHIIDGVRAALRQRKPDGALLCELYGPLFTLNHDFAYDYLAHLMFFHAGLGVLSAYELGEWLEDHLLALPDGVVRVCFTETHDTRDVNPIADAVRGSRLAHMLLVGLVGCGFVPMLWTGQEQGQAEFVRHLLHVRANNPILRTGSVHFNKVPCDMPQVWTALRRLDHASLVVLLNLGPHRRTVTISIPVDHMQLSDGTYHLYELLSDQVIAAGEQTSWQREELLSLALTVDPFESMLLAVRAGDPITADPPRADATPEQIPSAPESANEQAVNASPADHTARAPSGSAKQSRSRRSPRKPKE